MKTFSLTPPRYFLIFALIIFIIVMGVETVEIILLLNAQSAVFMILLMSAIVVGVVILIFIWLLIWAPLSTRVDVGDDIFIRIPPYSRRRILPSDIKSARVTGFDKSPELKPILRTGGTSIGKYYVGNFWLAKRAKAVFMVKQHDSFVALETSDHWFILGPDDLEGFISALKERGIRL
jgi:hypothetical protein